MPINHPWHSRAGPRKGPVDIRPEPGRTPDPYVGRCRGCGQYLNRSECRQVEHYETCVHVCRACGGLVDESITPF